MEQNKESLAKREQVCRDFLARLEPSEFKTYLEGIVARYFANPDDPQTWNEIDNLLLVCKVRLWEIEHGIEA